MPDRSRRRSHSAVELSPVSGVCARSRGCRIVSHRTCSTPRSPHFSRAGRGTRLSLRTLAPAPALPPSTVRPRVRPICASPFGDADVISMPSGQHADATVDASPARNRQLCAIVHVVTFHHSCRPDPRRERCRISAATLPSYARLPRAPRARAQCHRERKPQATPRAHRALKRRRGSGAAPAAARRRGTPGRRPCAPPARGAARRPRTWS